MRKLILAFFILLLPLSAAAAVSLFPCESRSHTVSTLDAEHDINTTCLQDCTSYSCDELDEPSPSDHHDVVDGLTLVSPATPQGTLSFAPPRASPTGVDYAPLKPPPTR
ncbi:hypothetical protein [Duganella guangzhouensis]|uniref:hypothetical protein n=1 Tax=Duganella guangzhouensis TaxID=2666084 RepID=UPI0018A1D0F1|nr:hypothetical protein [Duganella guangzhouensis]